MHFWTFPHLNKKPYKYERSTLKTLEVRSLRISHRIELFPQIPLKKLSLVHLGEHLVKSSEITRDIYTHWGGRRHRYVTRNMLQKCFHDVKWPQGCPERSGESYMKNRYFRFFGSYWAKSMYTLGVGPLRVCQKKPCHFQRDFPCSVVFWGCFEQ